MLCKFGNDSMNCQNNAAPVVNTCIQGACGMILSVETEIPGNKPTAIPVRTTTNFKKTGLGSKLDLCGNSPATNCLRLFLECSRSMDVTPNLNLVYDFAVETDKNSGEKF
jgi:hypothetical protein